MVLDEPLWTAMQYGIVPLQSDAAVDALFDSLLGEIIQFFLLLLVIVLSIGAIFLLGMAGVANMSQNAQKQNQVSTFVTAAGIALVIAVLVGIGPTVLYELGFETMEYVDPVGAVSGD